ncbi:MAG: hypothetical protein IKF64_00535 [Eubacterium sp.]|nr:hypothetical protein [Eubacterium sp.]
MAFSVFTALSLAALFVSAVMLILYNLSVIGTGAVLAVYFFLMISLGTLALAVTKKTEYAPSFDNSKGSLMKVMSFLCAGGFVVEMVSEILQLYDYLTMDRIIFLRAPLLALTAVAAFLSAFSMAMAGISFGDTKYNIRRVSAVAFIPLGWVMLKAGCMLSEYINFARDLDSALKIVFMIFALCFFWCFAFEAVRSEGSSVRTVFFAGALFISGVLYFISRFTLVVSGRAELFDFENLFAVSVLLFSAFAFSFRKSITDNSQ